MKKKLDIYDIEHTVEVHTIKVEFPFYAKKESWYSAYVSKEPKLYNTTYFKFYDEFRYTEINVETSGEISLEFKPSGNEVTGGYELSYDRSYGFIIQEALNKENDSQVSTEEEFNKALELYKTNLFK